jgi:hypothetical protein
VAEAASFGDSCIRLPLPHPKVRGRFLTASAQSKTIARRRDSAAASWQLAPRRRGRSCPFSAAAAPTCHFPTQPQRCAPATIPSASSVGPRCHPWFHPVIRGSTLSSVGPRCHPWVHSAIRGYTLPSVGTLCHPWVHSAIRGSTLSSVGPLCHPWVHSVIRGSTLSSVDLLCYPWFRRRYHTNASGSCCHLTTESPRSGGDSYPQKRAVTKHWRCIVCTEQARSIVTR